MYFTTVSTVLFVGALSSSAAASPVERRDGPSPGLPHASDASKYCSWWVDINSQTTCDSVLSDNFITIDQFKRWNPSLPSPCAVQVGKSYCVETNGEPAPSTSTTSIKTTSTSTTLSTSTKASSLTSISSTKPPTTTVKPSTTTATTASNGISTPQPTQSQIVSNCDAFYYVVSGDTCDSISAKNGITVSQFQSWNPSVGSSCTGLWANAYACVSIIGHTPITTTAKTTTANGITTPTPTQSQIASNCDEFYYVVQGDTCDSISAKHGITTSQFQSWNPSVGSTCSGLWANAYACVSIIGHTATKPPTTTTSAGNGIATPTPIQQGMVSNCDAFYKVKSGDTCASIAPSQGITTSQIVSWNPAVKSDCTALWQDYYICVSIVGHTPTKTTGNGVTTPTPTQSGMTSNCKSFHYVTDGQTCDVITKKYGISMSNFVSWNPAVKSDCTGMWSKTYVCIAIL